MRPSVKESLYRVQRPINLGWTMQAPVRASKPVQWQNRGVRITNARRKLEGQERSNRNEDLAVPPMPRKRATGQVHCSYRLLSPASSRQYGGVVVLFLAPGVGFEPTRP